MTRLLATIVSAIALPLPSHAQLVADRANFQNLAEQGLAKTQQVWFDEKLGWYRDRYAHPQPVATLWSSFPLLETVAAIAIADPTDANKTRVDSTFKQAEAFWDPTINGTGGVSWQYGLRGTGIGYFDDAGWWALSYLDAYRATGKTRWLWDAGRALAYIDRWGWDPVAGGTWWDGGHNHKTSEPLAAAAEVAATLYRIQHKAYYLKLATKYISWADAETRVASRGGLYGRSATDPTVMDYVEGMMVAAHVELCKATKKQSWCDQAEALAQASIQQFPILADWAPETDVVYLRAMLDLYGEDGDSTWYALVYDNAVRAAANAAGSVPDMWSHRWDGMYADSEALFTQTATLELFAWLAATEPPAS
jgi:Glycosyl hydrolase family 76